MKTYSIYSRPEVVSGVRSNVDHIENLLGKLCINDITYTVSQDIVQNLIYFNNSSLSSAESLIRDIIVRELIACESKSSGSSTIMILFLLELLKRIDLTSSNKEKLLVLKDIKAELSNFCKTVSPFIKKATEKDILKIVKFHDLPENVEKILIESIYNIDPRNNCEVEKTSKRESSIEKKEGHIIKIENIDLFKYNLKKWKKDNSNCILVDGIIERVSQINHILEIFSKTKEPVVIFCREARQEVRDTILVNSLRKTLDIVLIEIGFETESVHFFKDMNAIFNCDFANIKKGDVVSSRLKDLIFKIEHVEIENSTVSLVNSNIENRDFLKNYTSDILNMRSRIDENSMDVESVNNIKKIIDSRLSFLSSRKIKVKIGTEDFEKDKFCISKIDKILRSFPDISSFGVLDFSDVNNCTELSKRVFSGIERDIFSQKEIFDGLVAGYRVFETILKTEKLFTINP